MTENPTDTTTEVAGPSEDGPEELAPRTREIPKLRLGFARGVAPAKWERRWRATATGQGLELVPLELTYGSVARGRAAAEVAELVPTCDVIVMRTTPGAVPAGSEEPNRTLHALQLYTEAIALVVAADHELAEEDAVTLADLELVTLLDHPEHPAEWPAPQQWDDPSWMPKNVQAALRLVATGAGGVLLPLPLARHLTSKREHAILPIHSDDPAEQLAITEALPGSIMWATWTTERDAPDLQVLAGVLRGRTARSSRTGDDAKTETATNAAAKAAGKSTQPKRPAAKKSSKLKPNSRGAQLAAAREKAERKKAEARQAKKRKRR